MKTMRRMILGTLVAVALFFGSAVAVAEDVRLISFEELGTLTCNGDTRPAGSCLFIF